MNNHLSMSDRAKLADFVSIYVSADKSKSKYAALSLPSTLHAALDYVRTQATESEIEMIVGVIEHARRELNKLKKKDDTGEAASDT